MDKDLLFLKRVKTEDLILLVNIMKDRISNGLSAYATSNPSQHVEEIAQEICLYGGNTLVNLGRGVFSKNETISYHELLQDVCKRKKVSFHPNDSTSTLGKYLHQKVEADFRAEWDDMSMDERKKILDKIKTSIGEKNFYTLAEKMGGMSGMIALSGNVLLKQMISIGGIHVYYGLVKGIVFIFHNILRTTAPKVLIFGAPQVLKRALNVLFGPIGWGIIGAWTLFDFASPAYRVTIPLAIMVELLRLEYKES